MKGFDLGFSGSSKIDPADDEPELLENSPRQPPPYPTPPETPGDTDPPPTSASTHDLPNHPSAVIEESATPMLEVHPPHTALRTWRDFVIHIGTITVGLLIAVGIEQTVEFIHHRHQVAEARKHLDTELRINIATFHTQLLEIRRYTPLLQRNLEVFQFLREHPGAPRSSWPGELSWYYNELTYELSSFNSTRNSGVLGLMPRREIQERSDLADNLAAINTLSSAAVQLVWRCKSYGFRNENPARMTPAELDLSIQSTTDLLTIYVKILAAQWNLNHQFPLFSPSPTPSEWQTIAGAVSPETDVAETDELGKLLDKEIERIQALDADD